MRISHATRLIAHCLKVGFEQTFADKILLVGTFAVYATIMVLYGGVIRMIPLADLAPFGLSHTQMIWYLGTTEFILFSAASWGFKEVQNEFLTEQAHLSLLRPYSSALLHIWIWAGQSLSRTLVLFPPYIALMLVLTGGEMPISAGHMFGLIASMPLACFMMLCAHYAIGASCLWFVQAEPASWVWQKSIFLFGAMLWPVVFYPVWLRTLVWFTPFPGILMLGGNWTLDLEPLWYWAGFAHQLVWTFLFYQGIRRLDGVVLRRIQREGA